MSLTGSLRIGDQNLNLNLNFIYVRSCCSVTFCQWKSLTEQDSMLLEMREADRQDFSQCGHLRCCPLLSDSELIDSSLLIRWQTDGSFSSELKVIFGTFELRFFFFCRNLSLQSCVPERQTGMAVTPLMIPLVSSQDCTGITYLLGYWK